MRCHKPPEIPTIYRLKVATTLIPNMYSNQKQNVVKMEFIASDSDTPNLRAEMFVSPISASSIFLI